MRPLPLRGRRPRRVLRLVVLAAAFGFGLSASGLGRAQGEAPPYDLQLPPLPPYPGEDPDAPPRPASPAEPRPSGEDAKGRAEAEGATDGTEPTYVFEAAARSGFASAPIRGAVNPFGAGFGARVGFNLSRVYLGATIIDYIGGADLAATDQALLFGIEAGYSVPLGSLFTLRPELGIGDAILTHNEPITSAADVVTSASGVTSQATSIATEVKSLYLQPRAAIMFTSGHFFASVTGGALVLPSITYGPSPAQATTWLSYTLEGEIGFRL